MNESDEDAGSSRAEGASRRNADRWAAALAVAYSLILMGVGYAVFVDATAAVYYNADRRIAEAVDQAWLWVAAWGLGNGALAYVAYRTGLLRLENGVARIAAAWLLVVDLTLLLVLGVRGGDWPTLVVFSLVIGGAGTVAWQRPGWGGALLVVLGGMLAFGALFSSASYEGEASELLFDEDVFFIFSLGLIPLLSGLLSLVAKLLPSRRSEGGVASG